MYCFSCLDYKFNQEKCNHCSGNCTYVQIKNYNVPLYLKEKIYYEDGDQVKNCSKPGDVVFKINYAEDPEYKIDHPCNLYIEKKISLVEYLYGVDFILKNHPSGKKIKIKYNKIYQNPVYKVLQKGLPIVEKQYGNLYINFILDWDGIEKKDILDKYPAILS